MPAKQIRLDSLLSIVSRQTGARFSLNTSKFPPSRIIHVPKGPMPVAQLLTAIKEDTGIFYTVLGGHIIFIDNPPRKSNPPSVKKQSAKKEPVRKSTSEKSLAKQALRTGRALWDLQSIPTIYFVTDTLVTSGKVIEPDSAWLLAGAGSLRDTIRKQDSIKAGLVYGIQRDSIKEEDTLRIAFASGNHYNAIKTTDSQIIHYSTPADDTHNRLLRFSSWQLDPSLHWGWGSGTGDTLRNKIITIARKDSTNIAEQQPTNDAINQTPKVATDNKVKNGEIVAATASLHDITIEQSTNTAKTSLVKSILQNTFSNRYQKPDGQGVRRSGEQGPFSFLLNLGVTGDESYYVNPTIQIGLPFLYGIASAGTNFNLVGFRVGAGIAARISEDWRIHLQMTTGKQLQDFSYGNPVDTIGEHISGAVNMRLMKFSLVAERKLGEHFRLQAGLVFNSQRLQYRADSNTVYTPQMVYQRLNIIHAPYTISDTYNGYLNTKTWIGFQLGIFYNINFKRRK
ncbi:hypothetical protein [Chitinophaga sp. RAB17]|uniref:hypothetical protein n=1 Tax=Chitinophaga sp. RAB17 TaxID=3233049 RepID=UPI003F917C29